MKVRQAALEALEGDWINEMAEDTRRNPRRPNRRPRRSRISPARRRRGIGRRRRQPTRRRLPLPRRPRPAAADDVSPLLNRRQWLGLAWGAFSAASAAALAATGRFMFPERAQRAAAAVQGRPADRVRHGRRRALEGQVRHLDRQDTPTTTSSHASGFYALISTSARISAARRTTSSAENKFKCPCHGSGFRLTRRQLRGPDAAPARARAHRARRRRTDPRRQEPPLPAGARAVDRSGSVSEGVGVDRDSLVFVLAVTVPLGLAVLVGV